MAQNIPIAVATTLDTVAMATGIFAQGDERRYMRLLFQESHSDGLGGSQATTIAHIHAVFTGLATVMAAKLQDITLSIYHDLSEGDIPVAGPGQESSAYMLLSNKVDGQDVAVETLQVRVPRIADEAAFITYVKANLDLFTPLFRNGDCTTLVNPNFKPEKKARASV